MSNFSSLNNSDNGVTGSQPIRPPVFRPISAKQSRDPSQRKSVSFNDVPIVHEVPLHDTSRNQNNDIYKPWITNDMTLFISNSSPPLLMSTVPMPSSSNMMMTTTPSTTNSNATGATTTTTTTTTSTTSSASKLPIGRIGSASSTLSSSRTIESSSRTRLNKSFDESLTTEDRSQKTYSNTIYIPTATSLPPEHIDEKRYSYRPAMVPENDHYKNLPFTYGPISESTATYSNLISSLESSSPSTKQVRNARVRSATLPVSRQSSNEGLSFTSPRSNSNPRALLKPTTIAFQTTPSSSTNVNLSSTNTRPTRISSGHSSSSSRITSSTLKYPFAPLSSETHNFSAANSTRIPSTGYSRSRSANALNTRRQNQITSSPDRINQGNITTINKRNPNVRQTYGSYYMHRVLLPANIR